MQCREKIIMSSRKILKFYLAYFQRLKNLISEVLAIRRQNITIFSFKSNRLNLNY